MNGNGPTPTRSLRLAARLCILLFLFVLVLHVVRPPGASPDGEDLLPPAALCRSVLPEATEIRVASEPFPHLRLGLGNGAGEAEAVALTSRAAGLRPSGWGGEMNLMAVLDGDGTVRSIHMLANGETPTYVDRLRQEGWFARLVELLGRGGAGASPDVDGATGASVTAQGVAAGARALAERARREILGISSVELSPSASAGASMGGRAGGVPAASDGSAGRRRLWPADRLVLLVAVAGLAAFALRRSGLAARGASAGGAALLGAGGVFLSAEALVACLNRPLAWPGTAPLLALALLVVLLATWWCGRVFCAVVCPLGFLQELAGRGGRCLLSPLPISRRLLFPKYLLLAALLAATLSGAAPLRRCPDPILSLHTASVPSPASGLLLAGLLVAAVFAPRLWCRCLCPLGAFLGAVASWGRGRGRPSCRGCHREGRGVAECLLCPSPRPSRAVSDGGDPSTERRAAMLLVLSLGLCIGAALVRFPSRGVVGEEEARRRELRRAAFRRLVETKGLDLHEARYWRVVPASDGSAVPTGGRP